MSINDKRKLRVYRVMSIEGELSLHEACDLLQGPDGKIAVSGLWDNSLLRQEDLGIQAEAMNISPLELVRLRLMNQPSVVVEVI